MSSKKTAGKTNKVVNPVAPVVSVTNNTFTPGMLAGLGLGVALLVIAAAKWSGNTSGENHGTKNVPSYNTSVFTSVETTNNVVNQQNRQPNSTKSLSDMQGLSAARSVFIRGPINFSSAARAIEQITALSKSAEPIYLFLDSPGGSVFEGEKIISAMESAKGPVNTVCIGICASMAAYIHQYGTERLAYDRAILMFHDGFGGLQGEVEKMNSMLSFIRRKIAKIDAHVSARSGLSPKEYIDLKLSDLWIDAEDAKDKGLVDRLVKVVQLDSSSSMEGFDEKANFPTRENLVPFNMIYTPQYR